MASAISPSALHGDAALVQTHDDSDKLCLALNAELVQETLSTLLREDVQTHNCMHPPGELSLQEEVADFAAISVDGAVMIRAMDQLGDLHESIVCVHMNLNGATASAQHLPTYRRRKSTCKMPWTAKFPNCTKSLTRS